MSTDQPILKIRALEAGYGGVAIVRGVDLDIPRGSMITFVGPNGAGKSSLLRAIYGSARVYGGTIEFGQFGFIEHFSPIEHFNVGLAFVPQGRCNFGQMSVAENLTISAHRLPPKGRQEAAEYVMDMFPVLRERSKTLAGNLSGGEQQMLEMAMVLQSRPSCLLVDEPSLGLSPSMQIDIFSKLADLRDQGVTVIAVEQNVRAALNVSDNAAVLVQGEIVMQGAAYDINNDEQIRVAYLGG